MNIIIIGRQHGKSRTLKLGNGRILLVLFAIITLIVGALVGGMMIGHRDADPEALISKGTMQAWQEKLHEQKALVKEIQKKSQSQVDALTLRMGDIQARLLRLDALGQRLTEVADLDNGEFDFRSEPPTGGPVPIESAETSYVLPGLKESLAQIEEQIQNREQQLDMIDSLFVNRRIKTETFIAGRPIKRGWLSSHYGYRTDPFTGKRAWHAGVDFAGKSGSDIVAVASGVVTWASDRFGYGNLVEINHGGGYSTRYGHCKKILVKVGDVVTKGQIIARMGSTGRSTGPHVHYEVRHGDRAINPEKYIFRAGL